MTATLTDTFPRNRLCNHLAIGPICAPFFNVSLWGWTFLTVYLFHWSLTDWFQRLRKSRQLTAAFNVVRLSDRTCGLDCIRVFVDMRDVRFVLSYTEEECQVWKLKLCRFVAGYTRRLVRTECLQVREWIFWHVRGLVWGRNHKPGHIYLRSFHGGKIDTFLT